MFKVALINYHSNIKYIYAPEWVEQFRDSVLNQTYKDYDIFEIAYDESGYKIFEKSIYESKKMPSFIHAMNYLLDKILKMGYDCACNLNSDDWYSEQWLQIQLPFIKSGEFDIVTCNFSLVRGGNIYHAHKFDGMNIKDELSKGNNVVAHPAVIYSRRFLEGNRYIPEQFPTEDLQLWQRTIDNYRFKIVPENLLYHRIHSNSVCKSENR